MQKGSNQRIVQLLSEIVDRTHEIGHKGTNGVLLDIDLIMEDLRELYKEFEKIRANISEQLKFAEASESVHDSPQVIFEEPVLHNVRQTEVDNPVTAWADSEKAEATLPLSAPEGIPSMNSMREAVPTPPAATVYVPEPEKPRILVVQPPETVLTKPADLFTVHQQPIETIAAPPQKPPAAAPPQDPFKNKNAQPAVEPIKPEDNSLHQRLAAQKEDKSLSARLQMIPITHIKEGIGINEKFRFINELFAGNLQQYNEATERLNTFSNIDEAFAYLNALGKTHSWDENNSAETIEKLAGIVMRRYMSR